MVTVSMAFALSCTIIAHSNSAPMLQVLGRKTDSGSERGSTTLFGITAKHFSHEHCQLGITQFFALSDVWRTASEAHTLTGKATRKMSTRCVWKRAV